MSIALCNRVSAIDPFRTVAFPQSSHSVNLHGSEDLFQRSLCGIYLDGRAGVSMTTLAAAAIAETLDLMLRLAMRLI